MLDLPAVIGHRGAAARAPENTLASFRQAAGLGCRMVEFDVQLSSDLVPVVFHDDRLERTTEGQGRVAAASLAQLKELDGGKWFGAEFAGERIPTLAETLEACLSLGLAVNIEVKGSEPGTAERALAVAASIWPKDRTPPLISSFHREALIQAASMLAHWPRGYLTTSFGQASIESAVRLGCASYHFAKESVAPAAIRTIRDAGLTPLVFTVNDPPQARQILQSGVAAVFSDLPAGFNFLS